MNSEDQRLVKEAKRRVKLKSDFKLHRNIYVCVITLMGILLGSLGALDNEFWEAATGWFALVLSWGIGLGVHFAVVMRKLKENTSSELQKEVEYLKSTMGQIPEGIHGEAFKGYEDMENSLEKRVVQEKQKEG